MTTLFVENSGTTDFRGGAAETNIDQIVFQSSGSAEADFAPAQFGPGLISNSVHIVGDGFTNIISIEFSSAGSFSAAGWTFEDWGSSDLVGIQGSSGDDSITGSSKSDFVDALGGVNQIDCGAGNDTVQIQLNVVAGTTIEGGTEDPGASDTVSVIKTGTTDLRPAAITGVERLLFAGSNNARTIIVNGDQIGTGKITTVQANGGETDALIVRDDSVNLTGVAFLDWGADETISIEGTSSILNTLTGSSQKDTIGGSLNSTDNMTGGDGADTLNGNGGNDNFFYKAAGEVDAGETLNGGVGTDTIRFENAGANDFQLATIIDVEEIDFVSGNSTATFDGDSFDSGEIATVSGSGGVDQLIITTDDQLTDLGGVSFTGWSNGTDSITILGSAAADILGGSAQADILDGGGEADFMHGEAGNDTYVVNVSNDAIFEDAGEGTDTVQASVSYTLSLGSDVENLTLTGNTAIDGTGNGLGNVITGNSAANTLAGLGGNDTLAGGGGIDTASYAGAAAGVTVALATTTAQNTVGDGTDTLSSMENLIGSGFADTLSGSAGDNTVSGGGSSDNVKGFAGNDVLNGDAGDDTLNGGANNDTLNGGENNDTLIGQDGNDTLNGCNGVDTASYVGAVAGVKVALGTTTAQDTVGDGTDTLSSIENLIGSGFADTLGGTSGDNTVSGGGGADNVKGFAGNDTLNGDAGDDTLNGGANTDTLNGGENNDTLIGQDGNDTLNGGNGTDTASYVGAVAGVTVALATTTAQNTVGDGTDTLSSMENLIGSGFTDTLSGTAGNNTISGGGGDDNLTGYSGHDTLSGDSGNDTLRGGGNNDTLAGGDGIDTAAYTGASAGVTVSLVTAGAQNTGGDGTDTLSSIENLFGSSFADTLTGSSGDNMLSGSLDDDSLIGGAGNDTLDGGPGDDTLSGGDNDDVLYGSDGGYTDALTGGSGADVFVFDDGNDGDTVTDFENGSDQFDLTAATGVDDIGDLTIIDNGATVTVSYGSGIFSGSFTITNLADPGQLDAGDFLF